MELQSETPNGDKVRGILATATETQISWFDSEYGIAQLLIKQHPSRQAAVRYLRGAMVRIGEGQP